ncbi:SDR family oxidoreductase [Alicyclobacillus fastidiosus]|uniref:SDR family oxidoreductase n=1 Tax=Alicyclobacillus fastidiosus TaxID=392011 RepID=A0ABY6ZJ45_9BACL|nr:SDR family oxidoreductase [Alicyclobacillus fastidiosus]WAH42131.1 SDR family oxidoreductase [Alicyclobacillus fastidiosus]GMA63911.1 oxidoreductase [Alicyclobacillus fastidiosus]
MSNEPKSTPVAIVTGGTQGLGFALAKGLLRRGFALSICARTRRDVEEATKSLSAYGPVLSFAGDIADDDVAREVVDGTLRAFGRIDAVVNNASTLGRLPLPRVLESTSENDHDVFSVNALAPLQLLRKAVPHLLNAGRSLVVGLSSDAAIGGYPGWGIYGASKAALDLLHKTLAAELSETGVHVYSVDPGDMDTAMHRAAEPGARALAQPADVAGGLLELFTPLVVDRPFAFASGARLRVTEVFTLEVHA